MRGQRRSLLVGFCIALLGHGLLALFWPVSDRAVRGLPEITYELARQVAPQSERVLQDAEAHDRTVQPVALDSGPAVEEKVFLQPGPPEPERERAELESAETEAARAPGGQALNLEAPRDWPGVEDDISAATRFRPEFGEALRQRRTAQARSALLGRRQIEREGLSIEAYNALEGPVSNHIKTAQGCFTLRSVITGELHGSAGSGSQWYMTRCKGIFKDALSQSALETDAVGRAVPAG